MRTLAAMIAAAVALLAACNSTDRTPPSPPFLPSWSEARASLESALTAWRDSRAPLPESFDTTATKFVDKHRKPNQRLRDFEILGQTEIENARQFTVRLHLDGEDAPQLIKYNVLGRQPVWIFRLDDYEMFLHWEHSMDESQSSAGPR